VGISVLFCGGIVMKKYLALLMFLSLAQWGCAFLGGAATGALATGAGYEINSKRQMDKLEDDYKDERISRREYEDRKKQIESGSIIY
jgi:biopolymer transport protein ExbB/TolQ